LAGELYLVFTLGGAYDSTDGSIKVDYGYTNRPGGQSKSFHTRQITFPILFTVYHTFEPHSLDIVRFQPNSKGSKGTKNTSLVPPPTPSRTSFANTADSSFRKKLEDEADDEHCLVCLSVRNVHGVPFEVTLERSGDGSGKLSVPVSEIADNRRCTDHEPPDPARIDRKVSTAHSRSLTITDK